MEKSSLVWWDQYLTFFFKSWHKALSHTAHYNHMSIINIVNHGGGSIISLVSWDQDAAQVWKQRWMQLYTEESWEKTFSNVEKGRCSLFKLEFFLKIIC